MKDHLGSSYWLHSKYAVVFFRGEFQQPMFHHCQWMIYNTLQNLRVHCIKASDWNIFVFGGIPWIIGYEILLFFVLIYVTLTPFLLLHVHKYDSIYTEFYQLFIHHQISNMSHTKSQHLNVSLLILQLYLCNILKPCIKMRIGNTPTTSEWSTIGMSYIRDLCAT